MSLDQEQLDTKIFGYDGPTDGCTTKTKTERDSKTESNIETIIKNIKVNKSYKGNNFWISMESHCKWDRMNIQGDFKAHCR